MPSFDRLLVAMMILVVGGAMILWSGRLSERYNAWTTRVRERQNMAPTPEWRARNTVIFGWILRTYGGALVLFALFMLYAS